MTLPEVPSIHRVEERDDELTPRFFNRAGVEIVMPSDSVRSRFRREDAPGVDRAAAEHALLGRPFGRPTQGREWIQSLIMSAGDRSRRLQALDRAFGRRIGQVAGLGRYVRDDRDGQRETLVDEQSAVPVEMNVVQAGRLVSAHAVRIRTVGLRCRRAARHPRRARRFGAASRDRDGVPQPSAPADRRPAMTRLILVIVIALSTVGHAAAQDRPVIFVHGFGSSGETWSGAASRLQTSLAIQPATPSLNARALYESQADDLQWQSGGLGSDAVAVGHSNGGLVARQWNRQHPLAGVITVGTPHGGAPLVRNLSAYAGFNWELVWSVNDVFRSFGQACCNWQWILSMYSNVWQLAADMAASSVPEIASAVAVNAAFPVTPEMAPGSSFLASINSSGNLTREVAAIPVRVGIVSTAYNFYWGGALRAAFPDEGDLVAYWRDAARFGMETYAAYIYANAPLRRLVGVRHRLGAEHRCLVSHGHGRVVVSVRVARRTRGLLGQ